MSPSVLARVPLWSLLAGTYCSLRHWPLDAEDCVSIDGGVKGYVAGGSE